MGNGWNSEADREAMLRRVAIVLSSLPAPVASRLLGSVGPESKQAIRRTMTSLTDVDPLERHRALQAFKVSVEQQPVSAASRGPVADRTARREPAGKPSSQVIAAAAEREISPPAASSASAEPWPAVAAAPDPSPLSFLGDAEDEVLVNLLAVEHPQAVALVLASIAPAQAARLLPRLPPSLQTETLSRIGRLGNIPEAAAAEVAEHFRQRMARQPYSSRNSTGRRALDAILAAMPTAAAATAASLDTLASRRMATVQPPLAAPESSRPATSAAAVSTPGLPPDPPLSAFGDPAAQRAAMDLTQRLRVAEHTWPEVSDANRSNPVSDQRTAPRDAASDPRRILPFEVAADSPHNVTPATAAASTSLDSTDAIHRHLLGLEPAQLCQALGRVDTRDAMLALCGLPNEVSEAALAILPRALAKKVRIKMNTLGSIHLREIDEAKEKVAQASLRTSVRPSNQLAAAA
jgi:flagellar motor switch protein FliG